MLKSWYDRAVLPRIIGCACSMGPVMKRRAAIVPMAKGRVFEIGCGGGLNQQFYDPDKLTGFAGIDPNETLRESARRGAEKLGLVADIRPGVGEDIPFANASFDTVVCTFTLCSVQDHRRTMAEMRRILKPGGQLLYLEHGAAPDAGVARWQRRVEPVWKPLAGGCHLTRQVGPELRGAGFSVEPLGREYMPRTPRPLGWVEWGRAVRN